MPGLHQLGTKAKSLDFNYDDSGHSSDITAMAIADWRIMVERYPWHASPRFIIRVAWLGKETQAAILFGLSTPVL